MGGAATFVVFVGARGCGSLSSQRQQRGGGDDIVALHAKRAAVALDESPERFPTIAQALATKLGCDPVCEKALIPFEIDERLRPRLQCGDRFLDDLGQRI